MHGDILHLRSTNEAAHRAFERLRAELEPLLPGVEFVHVGSTAVPGSLTKGDLDVQLRVDAAGFERARTILAARYASNPNGIPPPNGASFDDSGTPPIGLHLTVRGSHADFQWALTQMLREDASLRDEYDAIKRRFEGRSMSDYREDKERFFARIMASARFEALVGWKR